MRHWNVSTSVGLLLMGGLAVFCPAACSQNPSAPQGHAQLQLDSLRLELAPTGEVLVARGFVRGATPVSPEASFAIELATDGGDVEDPTAHWTICHTPDKLEYACHQFLFQMADGHAPEEIASELDALGMRIIQVYDVIPGGAVQVFRGTDDAAFHALATLPHVGLVEYNRIVHAGDAPLHELSAALPVNRSAVSTGNGVLELQPGQTITAWYQQPDGSVLTATLRM